MMDKLVSVCISQNLFSFGALQSNCEIAQVRQMKINTKDTVKRSVNLSIEHAKHAT